MTSLILFSIFALSVSWGAGTKIISSLNLSGEEVIGTRFFLSIVWLISILFILVIICSMLECPVLCSSLFIIDSVYYAVLTMFVFIDDLRISNKRHIR